MEICAIKGGEGIRRLMANAIKNFHIFFGNPSLSFFGKKQTFSKKDTS